MSGSTSIEWTDASWNPVRGCTKVSEGCRNCWAMRMAARFSKPGMWGHGFAEMVDGDPRWTGRVELIPEMLDAPLRWRAPRRIFLSSFDLFHESLPDEAIDRVFAVMALARQHTFQVLTKRPERMRDYMTSRAPVLGTTMDLRVIGRAIEIRERLGRRWDDSIPKWPLPNVWLGTSVESRAVLGRLDELRQVRAALRFVSFEPLLEDLGDVDLAGIDWAIFGGESGGGARPCVVDWIRYGVASCRAQGVAPFVKQLGARPVLDFYSEEARDLLFTYAEDLAIVNGRGREWDERDGQPTPGDAFTPLPHHGRKGQVLDDWPEDLRIREFPSCG